MRHIIISQPVPIRKLTALENRARVLDHLELIADKKAYIQRNRTWGLLKKWLASFSFNKCWYCEAITERAVSDVDHFRPKGEVTVKRNSLDNHDGYYWLAYDWNNFRFSCQRCNRPEKDGSGVLRGKANEFALVDESQRQFILAGRELENPLLLDPLVKADTCLLAHLIDGTVEPAAPSGTIEYARAVYTRDVFGLNSFGVPKKKRHAWLTINLLIEIIGNIENRAVTVQVESYLKEDSEYSQFFRSALSSHRDKDWIEAIL